MKRLGWLAVPLLLLPAGSIGAEEGDVSFALVNSSSQAVTEFHATLVGEEATQNLLSSPVEPGGSASITIAEGQTNCVRNLRVVFADQSVRDRPDVDLCNMAGYLVE